MARGLGTSAARFNGPPPDPNSLRSAKRGAEWTRLPRNIREGKETPDWPLFISEPTLEELAFWVELWKKPQAEFWLRDGMIQSVAMYVRVYISAMQPGGFVTEKTAAHRQADALMLTTPALLAAKILIVDPEEVSTENSPTPGNPTQAARSSVRNRFTVVTPAADEVIEDENESSTSDD